MSSRYRRLSQHALAMRHGAARSSQVTAAREELAFLLLDKAFDQPDDDEDEPPF